MSSTWSSSSSRLASSAGLPMVADAQMKRREEPEDRQVVAKSLPARRRRDDDHVPPGPDRLKRPALVRVEPVEPARAQGVDKPGIEFSRQRLEHGLSGWDYVVESDLTGKPPRVE